jgi:hypothetical protein
LIALKEELFLGRKSNRIVPAPSGKHNCIKEKKKSERKKYIVDRLVEGHERTPAINESNQIGLIEILDQIRMSDLFSNPPGISENQLMTSPFVKIEPLKILDVSTLQSDPGSGDDFVVNEIPINSPSADQNLRSAKIRKRSITEAENKSETVPELRKSSVGSEKVVDGGTVGKMWCG